MDALCALLDCALGFCPCYFLFGWKKTQSGGQSIAKCAGTDFRDGAAVPFE